MNQKRQSKTYTKSIKFVPTQKLSKIGIMLYMRCKPTWGNDI